MWAPLIIVASMIVAATAAAQPGGMAQAEVELRQVNADLSARCLSYRDRDKCRGEKCSTQLELERGLAAAWTKRKKILNSLPTDRAAVVAVGFLSPECQALAEQTARKLEEKTGDAPPRSPMPAVKAEQERQARAAAEAETRRRAEQQAEAQRLPAPRADQERRASAAAEAEMKPRAEQQRLSSLRAEQERQASAAAEAETKRKADEAERQRVAAAKAEERKAAPNAEVGAAPVDKKSPSPQLLLPEFPWPPPTASSSYVLPDNLFESRRTVGAVVAAIISALERNGYVERSFFQTEPGGIALVTRLERIKNDGSSFAERERWPPSKQTYASTNDLARFLYGLFFVDPGHYRVIVFILQDLPFSQSSKKITGGRRANG